MKHEIEIPDLLKGYRAVAFRCPSSIDELIFIRGKVITNNYAAMGIEQLIVEKIKPRRIVLEETSEINKSYNSSFETIFVVQNSEFIWREVKEGE